MSMYILGIKKWRNAFYLGERKMDNINFLKIIYFDEAFVADFMQIIAGGELKKTTEFITEVNSGIEGAVGVDGSIGSEKNGLSKIFSFLSGATINAEARVNANLSRKSDRIAKNILENTLLADFIALLDADKRRTKNKRCSGIKIFPKLVVRPEVNCFLYFGYVDFHCITIVGFKRQLTVNHAKKRCNQHNI